MMCNYFRFGGVARDLPPRHLETHHGLVFERLPKRSTEIDRYLTDNEIIRTRCEGIGVLTAGDSHGAIRSPDPCCALPASLMISAGRIPTAFTTAWNSTCGRTAR